jgi:DNA (cytosine-5)-methyltransferase 1
MGRGQPKFASFFSGCGGFDLGFVQAGFRCVGAFDIDENAVATHKTNLRSTAEVADLTACFPDSEALRSLDVLIAGTPCQGFSTVGKRDPEDPRNGLLIRAAQIATQLRPKVVLIENVAGVVSGYQRRFWDKMFRVLRSAEYRVAEVRCDASKMGVPQRRKRVVALAWNTGQELTLHLPEESGDRVTSGGCPPEAPTDPNVRN